MTPIEIAKKYVYVKHDALTDNQEIIDMTKDIEEAIAERLLAFSKYVNGRIFSDNEPFCKQEVDEWLANNCG